jgi:CubicO group peptidase (beta-lactamase class C family)
MSSEDHPLPYPIAQRAALGWVAVVIQLLWSVLLLTNYAQTHEEGQRVQASRYTQIARLIRSEFDKDNRGGLSVGVLEGGRLAWRRTYGWANEEGRLRTNDQTIYPIASLTNMVTGVMLLQLVERGKVHLADPVNVYVPEVQQISNPFPWAPPITLIQLATMTSGLEANYESVSDTDPWEKQLLEALPHLKFDYEPGTRREYSNVGYSILGLALSRAAGRPFTEYMRSEILKPLGMQDTFFSVAPKVDNRIARGYFLGKPNSASSIVQNSERDFLLPAGGLLSTLGDLAKLMRFPQNKECSYLGWVDQRPCFFKPSQFAVGRQGSVLRQCAMLIAELWRNRYPSSRATLSTVGSCHLLRNTALGHGGLRRAGFRCDGRLGVR